ncbi:Mur ligase family protein [Brevundimonas aveniformis]|uniref:Mur ligase family protein n=1 Tax=Brevundimonas aveniformis TaxID=370977 RepID=UPI0003F61E2C|nr:UDP-N-acetylmuramoyl-L-alanine--D-glutamate ligase [Brevundimonas aveniformis]
MIPARGFEEQTVAVFGLGRSGLTAARALKAGGAFPALWDDSVSGRMQAEAEGFDLVDLSTADWRGIDALVLSPGVPLTHPRPHWTVEKAQASKTPIVGDLELFARAIDALPEARRPKVVAVTGTNGKSTTTALIGWVLKQAGLTVHVGGNIGIGVLALPEPTPDAVYVIEVSSYQLDLTTSFEPDVAILTNMSPDHLDRHGGMRGYVAAKRRLFCPVLGDNRSGRLEAIIGMDDVWSADIAVDVYRAGIPTRYVHFAPFTGKGEPPWASDLRVWEPEEFWSQQYYAPWSEVDEKGLEAGLGYFRSAEGLRIDLTAARSLPGRHNAQNAAFAYAAATALGVGHDQAVAGLMTFPGLAHRMETVAQTERVRFVNDSKATNADAARQALSSYERVFWIAGGRAKDGGIDSLGDLFGRIESAFLIGEAGEDFARVLTSVPHVVCGDMDKAVEMAARAAAATGRDEIVLLSPACASFDQYPDFEARGEAFRAAVRRVIDEGVVP